MFNVSFCTKCKINDDVYQPVHLEVFTCGFFLEYTYLLFGGREGLEFVPVLVVNISISSFRHKDTSLKLNHKELLAFIFILIITNCIFNEQINSS